jgi:hypothetical protein
MTHIVDSIWEIGQEMVNCRTRCQGVSRNQEDGAVPRCLILETEGRDAINGVAVIGINPGTAKARERNTYREHYDYEATVDYWKSYVGFRHKYYTQTRHLLEDFGFTGPILWSELAKCENEAGHKGLPPLATLRTCTGLFLRRELMELPPNWPLFALGGEAYKALAYLYPNRSIVGLPHPTGSYGHFAHLREEPGRYLAPIEELVNATPGQLLWLDTRRIV